MIAIPTLPTSLLLLNSQTPYLPQLKRAHTPLFATAYFASLRRTQHWTPDDSWGEEEAGANGSMSATGGVGLHIDALEAELVHISHPPFRRDPMYSITDA